MIAQRKNIALTLALVAGTLGTACGGSCPPHQSVRAQVLEESEPNDSCEQAKRLTIGSHASGDLSTPGDQDYWKCHLKTGETITIELLAVATDQEGWNAGENHAEIAVIGPRSTEPILAQKVNETAFRHTDLDVPRFRAERTGEHCIVVRSSFPDEAGSTYFMRVRRARLGRLQNEQEPRTQNGLNDHPDSAEPLEPGTLHGFIDENGDDTYAFDITEPSLVRFEVFAYRNGVYRDSPDLYDSYLYLLDRDQTTVLVSIHDAFLYDAGLNYLLTEPGTYYLSLSGNEGFSPYFLDYERKSLDPVLEDGANHSPAFANPIQYGDVVSGSTHAEDTDYFVFEGEAGDLIQIGLFHRDGQNGGGNSQAAVGRVFARLFDPSTTTEVALDGPDSGLRILRGILQHSGSHYVRIVAEDTTVYHFQVRKMLSSAFETEPNGEGESADRLDPRGRASGCIDVPGDVDTYAFSARAGEIVKLIAHADNDAPLDDYFHQTSGHGSQMQPKLEILGKQDRVLASAEASDARDVDTHNLTRGGATCILSFRAKKDGVYTLRVTDAEGQGGPNHAYVIEKK